MISADAKLLAAIEELERPRTRDDPWQIPLVAGEVTCQLASATVAKLIAEIATSYGFSGLFWAAALRQTGGKLHTIDVNRRKFDMSREILARARVADIVTNH